MPGTPARLALAEPWCSLSVMPQETLLGAEASPCLGTNPLALRRHLFLCQGSWGGVSSGLGSEVGPEQQVPPRVPFVGLAPVGPQQPREKAQVPVHL